MKSSETMQVTEKLIEEYLQILTKKGRTRATLSLYQSALRQWYYSLPEDKTVMSDAAGIWKTQMEERGLAELTIGSRVSVLQGFLKHLNDVYGLHMHMEPQQEEKAEPSPETHLSREEYHMLLHTAKRMGRRRSYLLIKTIVCVGIRSQEFHELTVESVTRGKTSVRSYRISRDIEIPEPIRSELLAYAEERGVTTGPIFVTKQGTTMVHSAIWKEVKLVCREIGLPEEKGQPKNLYQLFKTTYQTICANAYVNEVARKYSAFLEEEEKFIQWE